MEQATGDIERIDSIILQLLTKHPTSRLSAWEVKDALKEQGSAISLSAVYDALDRLARRGRVRVLDFSSPDDTLDLLVDEGHLRADILDTAGHVCREAMALDADDRLD